MRRAALLLGRGSFIAATLLISLRSIGAQPPAMSGIVRQARGGAPIECLHVALLDSVDRAVAHTVTDSAGMFVIVAPDSGVFRIQFSLAGYPGMEGPLVRLSAGMITQEEYPLSFDNLVSGQLALHAHQAKEKQIDLADWHSAEPAGGGFHLRRMFNGETEQPGDLLLRRERVAAQLIVDANGKPRGSSWRLISSTDPSLTQRIRTSLMSQRLRPARIGQQPVCEFWMVEAMYDLRETLPPLK